MPNVDRRLDLPGHEARQADREKTRAERVAAAEQLRERLPGVRVDFDEALGSPKFVASTRGFLARGDAPEQTVRDFLDENAAMFGHGAAVLDEARLVRDYETAHNGMRTLVWQQELAGVRVFESTLQAHVTKRGELVNVASRLVPASAAAKPAGLIDVKSAISAAGASVGETVPPAQIAENAPPEGPAQKQKFRSTRLLNVSAETVWLPEDETALRLCWEVIFTSKARGEMFRALVDGESGEVVVRQGLTEYISDATYHVFTGDSPSPFSPGHPTPQTAQPPVVSRTMVTTPAYNTTASPNGWIDDGVNETRGNNVEAHTDIDADDIADTPRPQGSPFRVFAPLLDLTQAPSAYRDAAVVDLFFWSNLIHDRFYELGFTEAAGNFQNNNFGRGGAGNDAVQADAQDGSGSNNANFSTPPDGSPGRMQMFVFTGAAPARDGVFDHEIVIHEYTHGLSNRLVGGGVGISALQSRGLGEGWSDFYALCLLSEPADDPGAAYAVGGYAAHQLSGMTTNYYFGLRRYPYCTDLAKNPLTFRDIDPAQASPHTGVPLSPRYVSSNSDPAAVHGQGTVWCVTLWDARANLIARHGATAGNNLILQLVTDGMKLAPANPNFVQARDAIIQADLVANAGANHDELWAAFARRGLGANATSPASNTTTGVVESYDVPDDLAVAPFVVWTASGTVGSVFTAANSYTLTNIGTAALDWTAAKTQPWLALSPASGSLDPGASVTVVASFTTAASSLATGSYADTITFTNTTSGLAKARAVALTVEPFMLPIASEDWEHGTAGAAWTITGTGTHRTLVSTANGPHGGSYHLTMDSSVSASFARNEATWTVNLAGRRNVQLRFWVKMFGDEPHGPPTAPFVGGADFDGVAISADGTNWYEVQPLRTLVATWTRHVVDLDAALAAHGLIYSPAFKIRFNHYDDFPISNDGFAFDDIELVEVVDNPPAIALTPPSVALSLIENDTATRTVAIGNSGAAALTWSTAASAPVAPSPLSGSVVAGGSQDLTLAISAAGLTPGAYNRTLLVNSNDPLRPQVSLPVAVTVLEAGTLAVSPATPLAVTGPFGGPFTPASQACTLTNTGANPLRWTASKTAPWIELSSSAGTIAAGASTTVTATIVAPALEPGSYSDTIVFTNTSNGRGNTTRAVTLEIVLPAPVLAPEPPVTPATSNTIAWNATAGADAYEAEIATDAAFTAPVSTDWLSATSHTFSGLADSTQYYYRVRARRVAPAPTATWSQTMPEEVETASNVSLSATPGNRERGEFVRRIVSSVKASAPQRNRGPGASAAGTALTVDVLDAAGALLAANVSAGTDLNTLPAVASQPALRLRANLSTTNSANTPRLDDWSVSYVTAPEQTFLSEWSAVETSFQFNAPPTISPIGNQTILEDTAGALVPLTFGDDTTPPGDLQFAVFVSNPSLLPAGAIEVNGPGADRLLQITPAENQFGIARVTFRLTDEGGKMTEETFNVIVTPVNDAPAFVRGADQRVDEDAAPQVVPGWAGAIVAGPANEAGQALDFIVTNDHAALFAVAPAITPDGTLTYAPAPDANGSATVTVRLHDSGGTANGGIDTSAAQSFTITIVPVNDTPGFVKGADQTVLEDSGPRTVPGWATVGAVPADESGQALDFLVSNDHAALFAAAPALDRTGRLTFTPAPEANGSATVTVRLRDDGGGSDTSAAQSFTIVVAPVNDAPDFVKGADQSAAQTAGAQTVPGWATALSRGPADEAAQALDFLVSSDHAAMFAVPPAVAPDGTLTFTPSSDASGVANVTVRLHDDGGTADGGSDTSAPQTFTISTVFVNDPPGFVMGPDLEVAQDAGPQTFPAWARQISAGPADEAGQALDFRVSVDDAALFATLPALTPDGTLTFAPAPTASGTATVTVQLHDDGGGSDTSAAQSFTIAVTTFAEESGTYNGLVRAAAGATPSAERCGVIRVSVARGGGFTGRLMLGGRAQALKGSVDRAGVAHFSPRGTTARELQRRGLAPLGLSLKLDVADGTDTLAGTIAEGAGAFAVLRADRALYTARRNPAAPWQNVPPELPGSYTVVFERTRATGAFPQGHGVALATVRRDGGVRLVGTLADGTKVACANALSKAHEWPFYDGSRRGFAIAGSVTFRDVADVSDLDGSGLHWFRPASTGTFYPVGWPAGIATDLVGAKHERPDAGEAIFPGLGAPDADGNALLTLTDGGLLAPIEQALRIDERHRAEAIGQNTSGVAVKLVAGSGLFRGAFAHPITGRAVKLHGAILRKQPLGLGAFRTATDAGGVSLAPR